MNTSEAGVIGERWSNMAAPTNESGQILRVRWWQHPQIIRHINNNVCGRPLDGFSEGLTQRALSLLPDHLPLPLGISVGCGDGSKEMTLLRRNIVQSFDLYELADARIARGCQLARQHGLETRARFIQGDAFEIVARPEQYDLVHWNNSLHHMLDVERAIEWSWRILKPGGLFYMDDFVGPDRFQWSPMMLLVATAVRQSLPERLLINPRNPSTFLSRVVTAPDPTRLRQSDPSEAADSSRILQCVQQRFRGADISLTGGVVYHLALSDILANFKEEDKPLLERLLAVDDMCTARGETHYAIALALKV